MKIIKRSIYECDDFTFERDALDIHLYVDGELVLSGDEYHDKINKVIKGFLIGLDFLKQEYTYEETFHTETPEACL